MITICGENKQEYKDLNFGETLEMTKISEYCVLLLQIYYDENDKKVYNISIEENYDIDILSKTIDYFETRDFEEAQRFYKSIINMFKQVEKNKEDFE